jgi:hypothetical protein
LARIVRAGAGTGDGVAAACSRTADLESVPTWCDP